MSTLRLMIVEIDDFSGDLSALTALTESFRRSDQTPTPPEPNYPAAGTLEDMIPEQDVDLRSMTDSGGPEPAPTPKRRPGRKPGPKPALAVAAGPVDDWLMNSLEIGDTFELADILKDVKGVERTAAMMVVKRWLDAGRLVRTQQGNRHQPSIWQKKKDLP